MAIERCKGCELCVPACPQYVLSMSKQTNSSGFHYPVLTEGCTGCTACAMACPDFVFEVYRFELNKTPVAAQTPP